MAELRSNQGIPDTMDYTLATKGIIKRSEIGWGDYIQDRETELKTPYGKFKDELIKGLSRYKNKNVLDLGCGSGWLALELARAGAHVYAVDCSLKSISVAQDYQRNLSKRNSGNIHWIVGDMNNLPIKNNKVFDLVTSWDAVHHVQDINYLTKKLNNTLKDKGEVILCERVQGGEVDFKQKIGSVIRSFTNLLLPMVITYSTRIQSFKGMLILIENKIVKKILGNKMVKKETMDQGLNSIANPIEQKFESPFEDCCGREMITSLKQYFEIERYLSFRAFTDEIERSLYFGRSLEFIRKIVLIGFSWFDYMLIKTKLLDGLIIFIHCKKGNYSESSK
jgi:ubiquinone/menaquinone biosynthesis C-methylase UbiE